MKPVARSPSSCQVVDRLRFLAEWDSATEVALPAQHLYFHTIRVADMFRRIEREPAGLRIQLPKPTLTALANAFLTDT